MDVHTIPTQLHAKANFNLQHLHEFSIYEIGIGFSRWRWCTDVSGIQEVNPPKTVATPLQPQPLNGSLYQYN